MPFAVSFLFDVPKKTHKPKIFGKNEVVNQQCGNKNREQISEIGFRNLEIEIGNTSQPPQRDHMGFRAVERFGEHQHDIASITANRGGGQAEFDIRIVFFKDCIFGHIAGHGLVDGCGEGDRNAVLAGKDGGFDEICSLQPCRQAAAGLRERQAKEFSGFS